MLSGQLWQRLPQSSRGERPRLLAEPLQQRAEAPPAPVGLTPAPRDIVHEAFWPLRRAPEMFCLLPRRFGQRPVLFGAATLLIRYLPKILSLFPPLLGRDTV